MKNPLKAIENVIFSIIRTVVPAAATWLIGLVTDGFGPVIDENTQMELAMLLYGAAFGLYYLAVRLLETYVAPAFSWFLGDWRRGTTVPVYPKAVQVTELPPARQGE